MGATLWRCCVGATRCVRRVVLGSVGRRSRSSYRSESERRLIRCTSPAVQEQHALLFLP
jgi:hypothetical protein